MYTHNIKLEEHESAAKIDKRTGEITELQMKKNNIPEGKTHFRENDFFQKVYPDGWKFLKRYLTPTEYLVCDTLSKMCHSNSNSLSPLSDDSVDKELVECLDVSRQNLKPILRKLFLLGVYGKFELATISKKHGKYWIFNPHLTFQGRIIDEKVADLFIDTYCGKAAYNPDFELTELECEEMKIKISAKRKFFLKAI